MSENLTIPVEVYTVRELADHLGTSWQTVAGWKKRGVIPAKAVTEDGTLKKSVVDPLIADGTLQPPGGTTAQPKQKTKPVSQGQPDRTCREQAEIDQTAFDEYVREFWNQHTANAIEAITLPKEIRPYVFDFVDVALKYGFTTCNKKAERSEAVPGNFPKCRRNANE